MTKLVYTLPTDKEGIQLRLGVARGFFKSEGIDLDIQVVFGGPEIAAGYDSGAVKMGEMGSPPAITAIGKGARFKIVGSNVRRSVLMYFVAAPEIKGWDDLKGKTAAALTIGSCSYWYMRMLVQSHGLNPDKDVNVIGLGPRYARVLELFESGELQGAIITEPNVSIGEERGIFRIMQILRDEQYCPDMQWGLMIANQGVIDKEPELVRAVLRAARRSNRYCADHPDEWIAFGADHFGIDRDTMKRSIDRELSGLHYDCEVDMVGLQQAIELQERLGSIKGPMKAADIADLRFLPARESANAVS